MGGVHGKHEPLPAFPLMLPVTKPPVCIEASHQPRLGNRPGLFFAHTRDTALQDAAPGVQGQAVSKPCRGFRPKSAEKQAKKGLRA